MADKINTNSRIEELNRNKPFTSINGSSQITLYPLYGQGNEFGNLDTNLTLPIAPADVMFNEDSNVETIKLINFGEMPVGMNKKLATWSVESFFPTRTKDMPIYSSSGNRGYTQTGSFRYWFDMSSNGDEDPYNYYCDKLLTWKKEQTPLVFYFPMNGWGSNYNCQIKNFKYGRKDSIGNVYYQLEFQEYVEYTRFDSGVGSTDYSSDTYYPAEGENILQICKKLYGDSDKYQYFMNLNGMTDPTKIVAGQAYKVR